MLDQQFFKIIKTIISIIMSRRRTPTRLEKSFLDIHDACSQKARNLRPSVKEKGLVRMAENAIYYGIAEDDANNSILISEFFVKLRRAFQKDLIFYLNSEYTFVFGNGVLVDIISLPSSIRGEAQNAFRTNRANWNNFDLEEQGDQKEFQIQQFNINSGLEQPYFGADFKREDMQPHFTDFRAREFRAGEWAYQDPWDGEPHDI